MCMDFFPISLKTNLSQIAMNGHGLSTFKPVSATAHLMNLQCCCNLVLYFRLLRSVLDIPAREISQISLAGYFAGKQSISSHLFPSLSVTLLWHSDLEHQAPRNRRICCATLGMWVVSAPGHQGKGGQPQAFSLACAGLGRCHMTGEGAHTPLPYGLAQRIERHQGFRSGQDWTYLWFFLWINSEQKKER